MLLKKVSFFWKMGTDQQRFLNLVGIILSFLVVPEAKILVSKEGAAGCSSLVGKIPLIAGIRTHGRKASTGNGITLGKEKTPIPGDEPPTTTRKPTQNIKIHINTTI